jgi:cell wall-associated protease
MISTSIIKKGLTTAFAVALMLPLLVTGVKAQQTNWQNMDLQKDSVFGISTEKAYATLLKNKKSKPVIVAVIDAGVDYKHEDLKTVVWVNKKEIEGNGKDDDKNGYADDVHGWNFLGSAKGSVTYDNTELARIVKNNPTSPLKDTLELKKAKSEMIVRNIRGFKTVLDGVVAKIGKAEPTAADFKSYQPANQGETQIIGALQQMMADGATFPAIKADIADQLSHFEQELMYNWNTDYNSRDTVGDNLSNLEERNYGNNDVSAFDCLHGTHVAGIIAARRNNGIGIDGVADNAVILPVRAVPNGDERDKDIANAIYYAVDNGAKVINMSFGKYYSPEKTAVDKAIDYAVKHDVLLIKAAGNDAKDLDKERSFPYPVYENGGDAKASFITVGASGWKNDDTLIASFSNYGKSEVDVFAPGVEIYSTLPDSKYKKESGTSMAAPVVSGLAALIRSYYPKLKASQVKDIILKSVTKSAQLENKCNTGGIVNAYNALEMAATFK